MPIWGVFSKLESSQRYRRCPISIDSILVSVLAYIAVYVFGLDFLPVSLTVYGNR